MRFPDLPTIAMVVCPCLLDLIQVLRVRILLQMWVSIKMWAAQFLNVLPRHWLSSAGLGTMGYGLPAAIGARWLIQIVQLSVSVEMQVSK